MIQQHITGLATYELKVGEFKPEYVGKMQFYLRALDETVRLKDENFSIGIILCKSKSKTIVEYSPHDASKPIGVAEYKLFNQLPAPELIATLLDEIK